MTDRAKALADAAFQAIEAAHSATTDLQTLRPEREAGRAFSLVKTKLDEARLWLDEALAIADAAEPKSGDH